MVVADEGRCALCDAVCSRRFANVAWRGLRVGYRICAACGLVFQWPRMSEEQLKEFYRKDYRVQLQGTDGPTEKDIALQDGRARFLLQFLDGHLPGLTRHLDVGCSCGALMRQFATSLGCQSVGVEPGDSYRAYCSRLGNEVYASLDELKATSSPRFDLVSLIQVFEHVPSPRQYLELLAADVVADNGYLLLEVPNLYGHPCFEVGHLFAFSSRTLRELLQAAGFDVVAMLVHGRPRGTRPYYIAALARRASRMQGLPIRPDRMVRVKRAVAMLRLRIQSLFRIK